VKILAAYLSPTRPLIGADLTACFGGGFPVLMAGDLNAKYVDWNSRMTMKRLRDYADGNSCLIYGQENPTTKPYFQSVTPDVFDTVLTKKLTLLFYLSSCSELSSEHLPVLINTACRSSFLHQSDRPDFKRTNWANAKPTWKTKFLSTRNCST
jgi:hypothetical protein